MLFTKSEIELLERALKGYQEQLVCISLKPVPDVVLSTVKREREAAKALFDKLINSRSQP